MVDPRTGAALYRDMRRRMIAVARRLTADQLCANVPACPQWTVRDLLAHLAGSTADIVNDRIDGAPGEEWTAAQVAARAGRSVAELLDEWAEVGQRWEEIALRAEHPSFLVRNPYLDTGVHEADLYGALGLPRPPAEASLAIADCTVPRVAEDFDDLGQFMIYTPDREYRLGIGDVEGSVRVGTYELSRAVYGRRSRAQIEAWDWTGKPNGFTERIAVLPQTDRDLID
ncbi:MAG TPA: maleylpyruvate isomerase family mycothiol-dependent enzyme [Actinophytocola sp.]|uniref:maleylpyruvate isomerase family mycothiol-dependent enzyme n=1 Tax=Actinophytocola sp. TaxID=1872138 RepID=UPI002DDCEF10|nr:maleylpyruvate isomerase family mycothiol-dependent enzyme [Actinophytocola sp.]HEV2783121.1 maleylpyruvate isomerase family mycothiol-dependent enzyme [Actinophytocola sp.]